jgi:DNA repair protein RadA/Sms
MLLAVLEKRAGYRLSGQDVFLNIAGGIRVEEPAVDLAVCASLVSGFDDIPLPHTLCFSAEVGLGGEIRAVQRADIRALEAAKLGFKHLVISKYNLKGLEQSKAKIKLWPISKITELPALLVKLQGLKN